MCLIQLITHTSTAGLDIPYVSMDINSLTTDIQTFLS
jgi:hypothetical protein